MHPPMAQFLAEHNGFPQAFSQVAGRQRVFLPLGRRANSNEKDRITIHPRWNLVR